MVVAMSECGTYRAECLTCGDSKTYDGDHAGAKAYNWVERHRNRGHSADYERYVETGGDCNDE